jgi:(1->4)-alpha-D-glucan 1-alpha-D-glucosylmutase
VEGTAPPARNDEYLFFQNLIATWPAELTLPLEPDRAGLSQYIERLQQAMIKSLREGRVRSNWISPDTQYETAVSDFIRYALNPEISATFLENFLPFQQRIAEMGVHNSLVQATLKITSPGVPDFYQGSDLWDLNLADPDNRRPVDFAIRRKSLESLGDLYGQDRAALFSRLRKNWHDGKIKLALISLLLGFRRENPALFEKGNYKPAVFGKSEFDRGVCAFFRAHESSVCLVAVSLDARLAPESSPIAKLSLDTHAFISTWEDRLTGKTLFSSRGSLELADIFSVLPVALLIPVDDKH